MRELDVSEIEQVNGGDYAGGFVGGCTGAVIGAAVATGGMSIPLAGQSCLAGGTAAVIVSLVKDIFSHYTEAN